MSAPPLFSAPATPEAVAPGPGARAAVEAVERLNLAFHQNAVPVVGAIEVANEGGEDLRDVVVALASSPPFLAPRRLVLDALKAGEVRRIGPVEVALDPALLAGLTEAVRAELSVVVWSGDREVARATRAVDLLAPNEWTGLADAPELIAAFVRPNDPAVDALLREAVAALRRQGRPGALDGYEGGGKARAWEVCEAIWAALSDRRIAYALPPASFERDGQKVRSPSAVIERGVATCLDLALLYAAALEQAGLHPLVVLLQGHALVGAWLTPEAFPLAVVEEPQVLRKRLALDDLVLVETTLLTGDVPVRFSAAVAQGARAIAEDAERGFERAVDVRRVRARRVRPLALGDGAGAPAGPGRALGAAPGAEGRDQPYALGPAPLLADEVNLTETPPADLPRLEGWKRKLLDLSLRNRLLNFKPGKGSVALVCPNPGALEDRLAAGARLRLLPRAAVMTGADPRDARLHLARAGEDAGEAHARDALERGDLHADIAPDDLDARLTDLFRAARLANEEGGANSLHLALGFVSWSPRHPARRGADAAARHRAPFVLLPVALERRSARSGFRLVRHDDDARVNPTLLQLLRQDFAIAMPELEGELPADEAGLDLAKVWGVARAHLKDAAGFELVEGVVLSTFSFAKHLMWKDLVERTDLLRRNAVVRHLLDTPKETFGDGAAMPQERDLDAGVPPRDLLMPLLADSSQTAAVVAASRGRDFVLFGPPGTGKSQTIANIIVQLLGEGRRVLFVSQKTTALEVVRQRLGALGLGGYCLEVHSAKAQKGAVLAQLKGAWEGREAVAPARWEATTDELGALRARLNALVNALHRPRRNGLTAHGALGRVVASRDRYPGLRLAFPSPDHHDEAGLRALREAVRALRTSLTAVGSPADHPLRLVGRARWSPGWQRGFVEAAGTFAAAADALAAVGARVGGALGLLATGSPVRLLAVQRLAEHLTHPEAPDGARLDAGAIQRARPALAGWAEAVGGVEAAAARLALDHDAAVFDLDLPALLAEWRAAGAAFLLVRGARKRRVWEALAPFARLKTATGRPGPLAPMPADLGGEIDALIAVRAGWEAAAPFEPALAALGGAWRGQSSDPDALERVLGWAERAEGLALEAGAGGAGAGGAGAGGAGAGGAPMPDLVAAAAAAPGLPAEAAALRDALRALLAAREALATAAEPPDAWLGLPLGDDWLARASALARSWAGAASASGRWCAWRERAGAAAAAGLGPLLDALDAGALAPDDAEAAFEVAHARWFADEVVEADDALRGFRAEDHEDAIRRYGALDEEVAALARRVVAGRLAGEVPARTAFGRDPEWGVLAREIEKRARHMPLRQLFARAAGPLRALAPCVMMSPLSVAQFLPADAEPFDAVVFDEASQIPAWDAIGAIARGRQVIVVGDPKQLPPTTFFDRAGDDGVDAAEVEDLESILDECLAANLPHKRLSWHYRSRHESLIAFSNERYYEGRLVTFPSPVTDDRAVRYVHVPGGVYERGGGRVNREEARAVVADAVARLRDPAFAARGGSLGIVTFNAEQQRLIENLLDAERARSPEIEPFFAADRAERAFVKNLESVQGDERDVILFSVGYGPDAAGRVTQSYGPLNLEGGPRRLNVAITRARSELVVFAALRPEQIDLGRAKGAGVRDFKHFLEYAIRGPRALAEAAAPTGREEDSPFEVAVRRALEGLGWEVHPQVGASGFRIDLGVVHPDHPGRYLAGVECDGATYHRSATARDRDRLREAVLRGLGWQVRRVWSTDWWIDAARALDVLQAGLLEDLASDRARGEAAAVAGEAEEGAAATADAPADEGSADASALATGAGAGPLRAAYRPADLATAGLAPDRGRFHDPAYAPLVARMVAHVVAAEGPLFEDVLVRRVARAHGFERARGLIRAVVLGAVGPGIGRADEGGRTVLWPEGAAPAVVPYRWSRGDERDHLEVPLLELAGLAREVAAPGAGPGEVAGAMARALGLGRLHGTTRERFEAAARASLGG